MQNPIKSVRVRQNACLLFIINDPADDENFRIRSGLISQIEIRSKKRWELLFFFFFNTQSTGVYFSLFCTHMEFPQASVVSRRGESSSQIWVQPKPGLLQSVRTLMFASVVQALTFSCVFSFKVTARQLIVCVCMYVHVDQMHRSADPREFRCFQRMWCKILYTKFISSHATVYNQF